MLIELYLFTYVEEQNRKSHSKMVSILMSHNQQRVAYLMADAENNASNPTPPLQIYTNPNIGQRP